MSKRIIMNILFSVVVSIITTLGSCECHGGKSSGAELQTLLIKCPDSCMLVEPVSDQNMGTAASIVKVKPGKNTFKFDCSGKEIEVQTEIKPGQLTYTFEE